jgi:hypothetical protein
MKFIDLHTYSGSAERQMKRESGDNLEPSPATVNCRRKVSIRKPLLTREGIEMQKSGDLPEYKYTSAFGGKANG